MLKPAHGHTKRCSLCHCRTGHKSYKNMAHGGRALRGGRAESESSGLTQLFSYWVCAWL